MTELRIRFLGVPEVSLAGRPVAFQRRASLALLAHLSVTGRRASRSSLAGFLAGDLDEEPAQRRVSNTLADLRAAVGDYLAVTREWVAFDRERPHWIDVADFEAHVATSQRPGSVPLATSAQVVAPALGGPARRAVTRQRAAETAPAVRPGRPRLRAAGPGGTADRSGGRRAAAPGAAQGGWRAHRRPDRRGAGQDPRSVGREDVAGLASFLAPPGASYVTGATSTIDGGVTWNHQEQ
jgi:hypothetical protein